MKRTQADKPKKIKRLIPFRTFGFIPYQEKKGVRYIASRHGQLYPITKPAGTFRIVCFGGSTTEDMPTNETDPTRLPYPAILQNLLRERLGRDTIEVINVGFSAYSTPHMLILLELDVLSWHPDLVILSENINDLLAAYFPNFTFDYSNKYGQAPFVPRAFREKDPEPPFYNRLELVRLFERRAARKRGHKKYPKIQRKAYGDDPPAEAAAVFRRNLESFVTLAQANGIRVLLASQAMQPSEEYFVRHMATKEYNQQVDYPLQSEFVKHHHAYNQIIEEVAAVKHADFVDNERSFGGDERYFIDLVHYTKEGAQKLAANYAEFLIENGIVR